MQDKYQDIGCLIKGVRPRPIVLITGWSISERTLELILAVLAKTGSDQVRVELQKFGQVCWRLTEYIKIDYDPE